MLEVFVDNWAIFVLLVCTVVGVVISIKNFAEKPSEEQIKSVKEWLLYAVVEAERYFGGGTGQIKLRFVYDMFIDKFPYVATFITFNDFSVAVDEALVKMEKMLETNNAVSTYVKGA